MYTGHRSSAVPLALAFTALVLYASLYPFAGWRWPAGHRLPELLLLPWPPWKTPLDDAFNFFGYLPLGLLICIAVLRGGGHVTTALAVAMFSASALAYATEVTQHFLPSRHPSLKDWAMNSLGAGSGAALASLLYLGGWLQRWHRVRQRWFAGHSAGALALLMLWPFGLLFPTPVPWGLGAVGERLREAVLDVLQDVSWAEPLARALAAPDAAPVRGPLAEPLASTLGLLAPVLLAYAVTLPGLRRLVLAAGALVLGFTAMTLSTLLNFGPAHALAWMTPAAAYGAGAAAVLALLLAPLPRRLVQGLALVALTALVVLVPQAGGDPYFAQNLQDWEQGRFVHFHGLTQWLGLLWPYAAIVWLLTGLARPPRD
ncbi:MAG: VanZ family protein [Proteobacteria bacterium]|nr:VanZ family protein [Pseudomonadota bacterium]